LVAREGDERCNCSKQASDEWRDDSIEKKERKGKAGASFAGGQGGICLPQKWTIC